MRAAKTRTEIRRGQIAEAALALLGSHPGEEPSIAGIARRVGVVPSAVYRHYRGKDAILGAALGLVERRLKANVRAARRRQGDALQQVQDLFFRHAALLAATPGGPQVLLTHGVFGRSRSRRQRVGRVVSGYLEEVARLVAEGQAAGVIRSDITPPSAALVFIGMLLPAVVFRHLNPETFEVAAHARNVWPALQAALQAGSAGCPGRAGRRGGAAGEESGAGPDPQRRTVARRSR